MDGTTFLPDRTPLIVGHEAGQNPHNAAGTGRVMRPKVFLALALLPAGSVATFGAGTLADIRTEYDEPLPTIQFNDNQVPAGQVTSGVLTLQLELHRGTWHLLGPDEPGAEILAFAEAGGSPQIPAPMIRVPVGTPIEVTARNPLDTDLVLHGLSERRVAAMDSLVVPAGTAAEVRFTADAEGTYYYRARISASISSRAISIRSWWVRNDSTQMRMTKPSSSVVPVR